MPTSPDKKTPQNVLERLTHGAGGFLKISIVVVLLLGLLSIFMLVLTNRLRLEQSNDSVRMEAVMDVKGHLLEFHLWLEEYLSKDTQMDVDDIFHHLREAEKGASIIIKGGFTERGHHLDPTSDPVLSEQQAIFFSIISELKDIAKTRVAKPEESGTGTRIDQLFDDVFYKALDATEAIEDILEAKEDDHSARFSIFFWYILLIWAFASIAAIIVILRMESRRALLAASRDKAIKDLSESENRHKKAQKITHLGHWSYDPQTSIVEGSDELFNIFNMSPGSLALETFVGLMHPDDRESVMAAIQKSIESGEPYNIKYRLLLKDDLLKWVHAIGEPVFDNTGEVIQFVGTILDITENKRAEEELKESAIFLKEAQRIANLGTYIFDTRNGTWQSSKILDDILGIDETYEKNIDSWLNIICPDERDEMSAYLKDEVLTGKTTFDREYCIVRSGKKRRVHGFGELQYDENGELRHMIGIIQDITERKEMEAELLKTEKLDSLGVLAGGIAHDFNNLLSTILGNVSYAKGFAEEGSETYISMMESEKAILRARDLTQQLLTFSKDEEPIKKILYIGELIKDASQFGVRGTNIELDIHTSPELKPVEINEGQLNQVIHNLVINACHAMPQGGTIKVRADNALITQDDNFPIRDGSYIKISITDSGGGIPQENLTKIFDPFFTTKQMGKGLGLATVYTIIKNHHGYVDIDSDIGKGTTFNIYLPTSEKKPFDEMEQKEEIIIGEGRILIMDDEEQIRNVVSKILGRLGYFTKSVCDCKEVIDTYRKAYESGEVFDVVILDLTIPGGKGGKDALTELLEINPEIKAIVSSGYSTDTILSEYKKYGFKGFVEKPFTMMKLSRVIHDVLKDK